MTIRTTELILKQANGVVKKLRLDSDVASKTEHQIKKADDMAIFALLDRMGDREFRNGVMGDCDSEFTRQLNELLATCRLPEDKPTDALSPLPD